MYVLYFYDKIVEKVKMPLSEIPWINRYTSTSAYILNIMINLCKVCLGKYHFGDMVYLKILGFQAVKAITQKSLVIYFSPALALIKIIY